MKYHYLSLRLVWSLFKKFENNCKNKHKVQIKLSKVQTCTTNLASYLLTQWQFCQLTLKWLSGARAQDKNKQYYCCFLFLLFLFNYAIQGKSITWLGVKLHLKTDNIGFRVHFNAEFPRKVMNFPIEYLMKSACVHKLFTYPKLNEWAQWTSLIPDKKTASACVLHMAL